MAVPARKTSKQKKRSRRGHIKLSVPAMHYDATTGEYRLGHRVSPKGFYKGKQVLNETKKKITSNFQSTLVRCFFSSFLSIQKKLRNSTNSKFLLIL